MNLVQLSLLLLLFDIVDRNEWNSRAIRSLNEHLSWQRSLVGNLQVLRVLLTEDDLTEVDFWRLYFDESLLARADERDVDAASLT